MSVMTIRRPNGSRERHTAVHRVQLNGRRGNDTESYRGNGNTEVIAEVR